VIFNNVLQGKGQAFAESSRLWQNNLKSFKLTKQKFFFSFTIVKEAQAEYENVIDLGFLTVAKMYLATKVNSLC
jgi:hypothetical protein